MAIRTYFTYLHAICATFGAKYKFNHLIYIWRFLHSLRAIMKMQSHVFYQLMYLVKLHLNDHFATVFA